MGEGTKYLGQLVWESHDHHTVVTFVLVVGTAAMRNTKRGSWYIEALTQIFSERACDMHVADMLVKVSRSVWLGTFCPSRVLSLPPPLPSHRSSVSTLPVKHQILRLWTLGFCLSRWTDLSRSAKAMPLAQSSTGARRCRSTVAPCAGTSICSLDTLPRDATAWPPGPRWRAGASAESRFLSIPLRDWEFRAGFTACHPRRWVPAHRLAPAVWGSLPGLALDWLP